VTDLEVCAQPALRVADRLDLLNRQIAKLDEAKAQLKADMAACAQEVSGLSDVEIAEIYWRFETIPVAALGNQQDVLAIARSHPYWSWRCNECGAEVFITSRTDRKDRLNKRSRDYPWKWVCGPCRERATASRDAQWKAEHAARQQREHELCTMPYKLYLKTDEWQERRKAALRRAAYSCQVCNRRRILHVHHRTYERRGAELARDLIALCDECHALYHGKGLLAPHDESR
jgi:hypothetical protein